MSPSRSKSKAPASLGDLPQNAETWCLVVRRPDVLVELDNGTPIQPFLTLLVNLSNELILHVDMSEAEPGIETVRKSLFQAMTQPEPSLHTRPHRPQQIQFEQEAFFTAISPSLWEIGVATNHSKAPEDIDGIIASIEETFGGEASPPPGLLSMEGVTPRQVAGLFAAAAQFYHAAPWKHLQDFQVIAAHLEPPGTDCFVQLMGYGGMEFGMVLYRAWEDVRQVFKHANNPLEHIPEAGLHSLTFEDLEYLPPEDVEAARKYGWKAVTRKTYPLPMIYREDRFERPDRQELLTYEALLRAVIDFVKHSLQPDGQGDYLPASATLRAQTYDGPVSVTLTYPAGEIGEWDFDGDGDEDWEEAPLEAVLDLDETLQQANDLAHQAWQDSDPEKRMRLARQALELSPECVEAYLVLAEEAEHVEEAAELCKKGVQAGEHILGEDFLAANAGHLWSIRQARPYLYIRHMLAECLALSGEEEAALQHCMALLGFNPDDHQGVRYDALRLMLSLGENEAAQEMIEEYEDDAASWLYTAALVAFRQSDNSSQARAALKEAVGANPYVIPYLLGKKSLPAEAPDAIGVGDESEAMYYVMNHYPYWWETPGAIEWLKKYTRKGDGS